MAFKLDARVIDPSLSYDSPEGRYPDMRFSWRQQGRSEGSIQIPAIPGNGKHNNGGFIAGVEKSFTEVLLFLISMALYWSHSLKQQHRTRS
jgi:hypothetical protein